ncbi:STAS domain-containing protein [Pseudogracilibacillus sp. SE30717A]|uniref:STAS domain-containing protein n=1 Tax=Pseudogracilibacillus sp. SE30717A TaxID=3098293 RepID=UPI00300DFD0A
MVNLSIDVIEEREKNFIVKLSGEIDVYTAPKLKKEILPLTEEAGNKVNIDLEHTHYLDSTGLGVFISAFKSTKNNQSEMKLINVHDRVLRLFKVTGLHEIMDLSAEEIDGGEVNNGRF